MITPKAKTMKLSQYLAPTFRKTMFDGSSKIMYGTLGQARLAADHATQMQHHSQKEQRNDRVTLADLKLQRLLHACNSGY